MIRITRIFFLLSYTIYAESSDSLTLQTLLQELRELRQDMQGIAILAQRVQLLLYRTQLQEEIRKRAAERFDQAKMAVKQLELQHTETVNNIRTVQEEAAKHPGSEVQIRYFKIQLETLIPLESQSRTEEISAGLDLKAEQARLADLQHQLDRLEQQQIGRASCRERV